MLPYEYFISEVLNVGLVVRALVPSAGVLGSIQLAGSKVDSVFRGQSQGLSGKKETVSP